MRSELEDKISDSFASLSSMGLSPICVPSFQMLHPILLLFLTGFIHATMMSFQKHTANFFEVDLGFFAERTGGSTKM